jgi:hypothetical protein
VVIASSTIYRVLGNTRYIASSGCQEPLASSGGRLRRPSSAGNATIAHAGTGVPSLDQVALGTAFVPMSWTRVPPRREFGISAIRSTSSTRARSRSAGASPSTSTSQVISVETAGSPVKSPRTRTRTRRDAGRLRFPEQIVGHAPRNSQIQRLATVEAEPAATSTSGTVDFDGVRPGRTDRRCLVVQASLSRPRRAWRTLLRRSRHCQRS